MLTVKFPQVHAYISSKCHGGLYPLKFIEDNKIRLVVKATKEMLLAARMRKYFKIFVAPVEEGGARGFALVSAFYDNEVDPLTITTPLFFGLETELFQEMLAGVEVDIHFFDENNIEFFGYQAKIHCNEAIRAMIAEAEFTQFSNEAGKSVIAQMSSWYIHRTSRDDENAIKLTLEKTLFPDDFVIIDARPASTRYIADSQISINRLERVEPGAYQERDIATVFSRIFPAHQIYLNPLRPEDREEIADVLIIGNDHILFVQAKDSPNTEKSLQNSVVRKKATTIKHLQKGLRQVEGAIKYALKSKRMTFLIGEREFSVATDKAKICGLIVVKELFLDEYEKYTDMTMKACSQVKKPIILLEYNELHTYTMNLHYEKEFFDAFNKVFLTGEDAGLFPRLRFGLA